jgi:hypothetical protein
VVFVIEGNQIHVASTNSSISYVCHCQSGNLLSARAMRILNKDTYLVSCKEHQRCGDRRFLPRAFTNYTINGTAATSNTTTHTATSLRWPKVLYSCRLQPSATSTASSGEAGEQWGDDNRHLDIVVNAAPMVTALWDFEHDNPSALSGLILNGVQGRIPSTDQRRVYHLHCTIWAMFARAHQRCPR